MAKKSETTKGKRQEFREMRKQRQRRNRILIVAAIVIFALVMVLVIAGPMIQQSMAPVGEFVAITPEVRPDAVGTALGDPNAPVKIDVWEDFQCSACMGYSQSIEPQVVETYVASGQVYYVFHNYPFLDDQVPVKDSDRAANASMCAEEQGRFWDYHDMLYANFGGENQGGFSEKRLVAFADALGLDGSAFESCLKAERYQDKIDADILQGDLIKVQGTPSVFVNGVMLTPGKVPSFEQIAAAVEAALAAGQ